MQHALHPQEEGSEWMHSPFGYKSERSPQLLPSDNLQAKWGQQRCCSQDGQCWNNWSLSCASPEQGYRAGAPCSARGALGCSGHPPVSSDTITSSTKVWASSGFTLWICPIPLLSPLGCSWLQQPLGSMRLQGHTSAPSPREKIKPSGYRDRKPLICHRKSAQRPKIWPIWAGLNSNSTTGRVGPSYFWILDAKRQLEKSLENITIHENSQKIQRL